MVLLVAFGSFSAEFGSFSVAFGSFSDDDVIDVGLGDRTLGITGISFSSASGEVESGRKKSATNLNKLVVYGRF